MFTLKDLNKRLLHKKKKHLMIRFENCGVDLVKKYVHIDFFAQDHVNMILGGSRKSSRMILGAS